jgi:hypothetical protein
MRGDLPVVAYVRASPHGQRSGYSMPALSMCPYEERTSRPVLLWVQLRALLDAHWSWTWIYAGSQCTGARRAIPS